MLQTTDGILALVAAGVGLSLIGAALFTYLGADGKSQLETSGANDRATTSVVRPSDFTAQR